MGQQPAVMVLPLEGQHPQLIVVKVKLNMIYLKFLYLLTKCYVFVGKLFVGGLSWQTTPEKLKEYFGQFGSVTDVLVMKDPVTQVINFAYVILCQLMCKGQCFFNFIL